MTGFWGMDVAQAEDFSGRITTGREHLDDQFSTLRSTVDNIVGSSWIGPDADGFGGRFHGEVTATMTACTDLMARLADEILQHVDAQNTASDVNGAGGPGSTAGEDKGFWEKFGEKILSNLNPFTPMNAISNMLGITHGLPGWLLDSAPRFIPILGDVYSGLLAGVDRFANESHLPLGERLGRAALDGVLTGGGSFLGGTALSALGAAGGVLIGGGSLGAAGAAGGAAVGGVGAIPGAIGGAGGGAIAGGVIGGIAGDIVGSHVGAAAGNALAHAILD